jgi:hypothetical protein
VITASVWIAQASGVKRWETQESARGATPEMIDQSKIPGIRDDQAPIAPLPSPHPITLIPVDRSQVPE